MLPVGVDSFALGQQPLRLKTQVGYLTRVLLLLNNCSFEKLRLTKTERINILELQFTLGFATMDLAANLD